MGKDQTVGRSMKIWQMPRLFSYFFAPFPYFCLFIFRCLYDYVKNIKYDEYWRPWDPIGVVTGKCVEKAKFCLYKRLELRYTRLRAQSAMDEYEDWIWRAKRLKLRAGIHSPTLKPGWTEEDLKTAIFMVKNQDAYDLWEKAKMKIVQLKWEHKSIRRRAHSLKKAIETGECKSKN